MRNLGKPLLRASLIVSIGIGAITLMQGALSPLLQAGPAHREFPPAQTPTTPESGQPDSLQRGDDEDLRDTIYSHQDDYPPPDLVIRQIGATPQDVQVVVENIGQAPVIADFWVDVYINPDPAPTGVNQVWYYGRCRQGLVWGVTASQAPMSPGDTITLRVGGQYYSDRYSRFGGLLPGGTEVWAQVDSVNTLTNYGGVLETHEASGGAYNNIAYVVVAQSPD